MNADVRRPQAHLEPLRLNIPEAAWQRLRLRLGRSLAGGEPLEVALAYGVAPDELGQLLDYWLNDFDLDEQPLSELPCFELGGDSPLSFVHLRSAEALALPLLLLHGYSGSLAEFTNLLPALVEPRAHGASPVAAFDAVCPSLPGFGLSGAVPCARAAAEQLAALMARLGYSRYVVHGSDLGASIGLELATLDAAHVAAVHVTSLAAYPAEDPFELASLSGPEKSQLAGLAELRNRLLFQLPDAPLAALGFALSQLDAEALDAAEDLRWRDALLAGLSLTWAFAAPTARNDFYRDSALVPATPSRVPVALHAFPLAAPSLRRFAERAHHVVEWVEHPYGGGMPALDAPNALLGSLRACFARYR